MIDIGHPAHVHFFKNFINIMEKKGHTFKVTARDREVIKDLLDYNSMDYKIIGYTQDTLMKKAFSMMAFDLSVLKVAREFKPDILMSYGSPYAAQVSKLIRKPHIAFNDTEMAKLLFWLTYPFSKTVCTPVSFMGEIGKKHVKYNGFKELAYLHPTYFKPEEIRSRIGLKSDEKIISVRFISFSAFHDGGLNGVSDKVGFIKELEKYGRPIISSDYKLDNELEKYQVSLHPALFHSLLYHSDLYIGEGGTTAVEAAIMGTPSIHIEGMADGSASGETTGNFYDLKNKYDLLYYYPDEVQALEKAREILSNQESKVEWARKRDKLLKDKIDVIRWMVEFVEGYPESFHRYVESKQKIQV